LAVAAAGPGLGRRLPPAAATRLLVLAAVVVAASTLLVGGLLAFTWLAQLPEVVELGPWSVAMLRAGTPVPVVVAAGATVAVAASVLHAGTVLVRRGVGWWRMRRAVHGLADAAGLIVLHDDRPDAYSTPPPGGRIVVSVGLLRALEPTERRVLLAHESSHLRHHHAWWVLAADVAAAVNPVLVPTARAVGHTVERWADEHAAVEVGDRALVARTLARSALLVHTAGTAGTAGTARTGGAAGTAGTTGTGARALGAVARAVPQRVRALLAPAPRWRPVTAALLLGLLLVTAGAAATVQRDADEFFDHARIADVRSR
jgi:Zn-dependent protease with chaperone function